MQISSCSDTFKVLTHNKCSWLRIMIIMCVVVAPRIRLTEAAPSSVVDVDVSPANRVSESTKGMDSAWPPMKHYDIWSADNNDDASADNSMNEAISDSEDFEYISSSFGGGGGNNNNNTLSASTNRQSKVIHLFPLPVDGECLSDDGRRTGTCLNAYECRTKGGLPKGECAMGFGVCCIFIANCNETISNNITFLVSPNFPSFMPNNYTVCKLKVKMMSEDISQLRIDFYHFSMGQPNRRTGVCDGDSFNVSGGPGGTFSLCGQNSGQHIYYDVGGRAAPRQTLYGSIRPLTYDQLYPNRNASANDTDEQTIEITMSFAQRFLPIRLWEIRVAQIPFSQRAPAGCLQYHTGNEGIIQTFNFADNGRHLANQHYRICMRQEVEMCSIMYQPCDEQSFRIGSSRPLRTSLPLNEGSPGAAGANPGAVGGAGGGGAGGAPGVVGMGSSEMLDELSSENPTRVSTVAADDPSATQMMSSSSDMSVVTITPSSTATMTTPATTTTSMPTTTATAVSETTTTATNNAITTTTAASTTTTTTVSPSTPLSDDVEGSGDADFSVTPSPIGGVSRRPRPVGGGSGGGGFDILGFLRSAFDFGFRRRRSSGYFDDSTQRQFAACTDRITMPCIIEDFIGTGFGPLPGCEPVHCGAQFCSSGVWPCRIESTVTPFYMGINFGSGEGKGSAEENIGACLRYTQVQCL